MKLSVLSDLHIQDSHDPAYEALLRILKNQNSEDVLVLAGDIFDLFVGNKTLFKTRYDKFLILLKKICEQGTEVHYIEGNHDFHLSSVFSRLPQFFLHSSAFEAHWGNCRFWIAHGDLVDLKDYRYLSLRTFFRSPLMQLFVATAPDSWIEWIGQTSSQKSREHRPRMPDQLPPDQLQQLREKYRSYAEKKMSFGYNFVILGHCHDLDEAFSSCYMNMGFPKIHGSYIEWRPGSPKLERKPFFTSEK